MKTMDNSQHAGRAPLDERSIICEPTNQQLRDANVALVQALDRVHDILSGDEFMENADIGIHEIINNAISLHNLTTNEPTYSK